MAEANFRNAAAQKSTAVPVADKIASYQAKATELASASALSESVDVANWAMGEALYRKSAAASRPAKHPDTTMPPAPQPKQATPFAEAPSQTPTRGNGALAALRRDLKAGAMLQAAQSAAWKSHQSAAMLAAANVDQTRQPATTQTPPGAIAAKGGWFSNTMTSALSKYDNGAVLAGAAAADTAAANNAPKTSGIDLSR